MASPSRTFQRGVSLLVVIAAVALFVNGYLYQTRKPHLGELLARNHEKTIIATACRTNKTQVFEDIRQLGKDIKARMSVDDVDVSQTKKAASDCRKEVKQLSAKLQHEHDSMVLQRAQLAQDTWHYYLSMQRLLMFFRGAEEMDETLKKAEKVQPVLASALQDRLNSNRQQQQADEAGAGAGEQENQVAGEENGRGDELETKFNELSTEDLIIKAREMAVDALKNTA